MTCASGSTHRKIPIIPNSWIPHLKKILSKKIGENYQEIIPQIEEIEKRLKSFNFFAGGKLLCVSASQVFPITWCHPPRVLPVPHCPPFFKCPLYEAVSHDFGDIFLKIPSTSDNLRKNL